MKPEREFRDYLQDILETMDKVGRFIEGMNFEQFLVDDRTSFAVVRALEIIGEGVHYVILTRRPLEGSTVVGWPETILSHPTCGGVPHGRGSRSLL